MADLTGMMQAAAGAGGAAPTTDPNFNQTVLLLHGDGTNGAQNNTFLDSSTNNFTITRNGNTTQGTFSPFSLGAGYWGMYNAGGNSKIAFPDNAAFQFGSGEFTVEAWFNFADFSASHDVMNKWDGGGSDAATSWLFRVTSATTVSFDFRQSNGSTYRGNTFDLLTTLQVNTWYHLAITREGDDFKCWLDGVLQDTVNSPYTINNGSQGVTIGYNSVGTVDFRGYISNARIVKGSAVYTSAFTPSTTPLTAISGTSLLTCQDNRFVDNSSNAFAVTVTGTPKVTPFSPFLPTAEYDASVNGGSGYFDGSGDNLDLTSYNLNFPAGSAFTIECWVYLNSLANLNNAVLSVDSPIAYLTLRSNTDIYWLDNGSNRIASSTGLTTGQWFHIAVCRDSSNNMNIYVNGVSKFSGVIATNIGDASNSVRIGDFNFPGSGVGAFPGYISNLRISDSARYSSAFTPPTAPFTDDANTDFLFLGTNAGIFDNTGKNNLETVADAQIDTTTKKYGTGSMEFDGTGDWLLMANTPDQQLGTGNFTIEFWVYLATGDIGSARGLVAKGGASTGWLVSLDSSEKVVFTYTTSTITSSGAITTNAWNHIAVVREGTGSNETKIYIGGTNDGTGTVSTDFNQTEVMYVGANRAAGDPMKGFIDDLRITKGVARYTANFTPPSAAFPNL